MIFCIRLKTINQNMMDCAMILILISKRCNKYIIDWLNSIQFCLKISIKARLFSNKAIISIKFKTINMKINDSKVKYKILNLSVY
jgi:hypothetical protein